MIQHFVIQKKFQTEVTNLHLYGVLTSIVSDQDPRFTSRLLI